MKTVQDLKSIQSQAILRLNCPGYGQASALSNGYASNLASYRVIIVNPLSILHLFEGQTDVLRQIDMAINDGLTSCKLADDGLINNIASEIDNRSQEMVEFLGQGGLLVYFLCRPFLLMGKSRSLDNYAWLLGLAPDQSGQATVGEQIIRHMSTVAHGRNVDKTTEAEGTEFSKYFDQPGLEWNTIIRSEFLSEGYTPLALAGPKKCIAGRLMVGDHGGQVIFLPAPYSPDFDRTLIDCIYQWHSNNLPEDAAGVPGMGQTDNEEARILQRSAQAAGIVSAPANQAIQPAVEPVIKAPVNPAIQPAVEPVMKAPVNPAIQPAVEPVMKAPVNPAIQPAVEPVMKAPVNPAIQPAVEPVMKAPVNPAVQPAVEPVIKAPVNPAVQPVVEPVMKAPVNPAVNSAIQAAVKPATEPVQQSVKLQELFKEKPEQKAEPAKPPPKGETTTNDRQTVNLNGQEKEKSVADIAPAKIIAELKQSVQAKPADQLLAQRDSPEKMLANTEEDRPNWAVDHPLLGIDEILEETEAVRQQIWELERQIASKEETIGFLETVKVPLLSGRGGSLMESCKITLNALGWASKPWGANKNELLLNDNAQPVALTRISLSQGQADRSELAHLAESMINYWNERTQELKGIFIACAFADVPPDERTEPDFSDMVNEFAKRKNICLLSSAQLVYIFRDLRFGKIDAKVIRQTILTCNGCLPGFHQ